jgi:Golgi phosphoprotein 3 GPP34
LPRTDHLAADRTFSAASGGRHEQPPDSPGENRHLDRRVPGLAGTGLVADDLYLLGHDDRSGRPLLQPRALGIGLAAALLAELMLARCVSLRPDSAVVIARDTSRDKVLSHPLLRQVAAERWPQPVRSWLRFLARSSVHDVALRLAAAGYLEHVRGRVRRGHGLWVPVNPDWAFASLLRVRSALDQDRPPTAHAAALTGLAVACGLGFRLETYHAQADRPVQDAVAQLGPGLRELIAQTQMAVDSAVLSHRT